MDPSPEVQKRLASRGWVRLSRGAASVDRSARCCQRTQRDVRACTSFVRLTVASDMTLRARLAAGLLAIAVVLVIPLSLRYTPSRRCTSRRWSCATRSSLRRLLLGRIRGRTEDLRRAEDACSSCTTRPARCGMSTEIAALSKRWPIRSTTTPRQRGRNARYGDRRGRWRRRHANTPQRSPGRPRARGQSLAEARAASDRADRTMRPRRPKRPPRTHRHRVAGRGRCGRASPPILGRCRWPSRLSWRRGSPSGSRGPSAARSKSWKPAWQAVAGRRVRPPACASPPRVATSSAGWRRASRPWRGNSRSSTSSRPNSSPSRRTSSRPRSTSSSDICSCCRRACTAS